MFRKRSRLRFPRWTLVVGIIGVLVIAFELYSIVVPFQSNNPLWKQVTVGQPVIDSWAYGGQDEEGYLKFYDQSESIVLPPTAKLFSADGQFVVIEGYSPSSLTYALPFEAIPLSWLLAAGAVVLVGGWFLVRRRLRRKLVPGKGFRTTSHSSRTQSKFATGIGNSRQRMRSSTTRLRWNGAKMKKFRARPSRQSRFKH